MGDAIDYFIWWYHVGKDDWVHRWQCNCVTTIHNDVAISILYMPGAMEYILSDGNHMNGNNTSISSLLDAAAAAAVASPWVQDVYSASAKTINNKASLVC